MRALVVRIFAVVFLLGFCLPRGAAAQSQLGNPMFAGLQLVADGLTSPVALVPSPDRTGRLFIVDQIGQIRILTANGKLLPTPFLDLRSKLIALDPSYDERGLLGLAFHPDYAVNGRFFVYYSIPLRPGAPAGFDHTNVLAELHVSATNPNRANLSSERDLLFDDHPQLNHNAGTLAFGPDGYLYVSIGDGGGANDVGLGHVQDWYAANAGGNGQDVTHNLEGNLLRLDVDNGFPYTSPPDNPFVGRAGRDEIYAYGFRNPYRFSFDLGGSHQLLVGDAGQDLWEEVDLVTKGGNYGWNVREGTHCFDAAHADDPQISSCPSVVGAGHPDTGAPLLDPVIEYANADNPAGGLGHVVIGGYVYRGNAIPELRGRYVFGDWSRDEEEPDGRVFFATQRQNGLWQMRELWFTTTTSARLEHFVLGFGQDLRGEVYVLTTDEMGPSGTTGKIYKLVPAIGR